MSDLIVTDEQARILGQSQGIVLLRSASGQILACAESVNLEAPFTPSFTEEEIAEAIRQADSSKTWHTTAEVLRRMQDPPQ